MNHCDRDILLPYLQDMCALITAENTIRGKLGSCNLVTYCGRVLMILACACFAWCVWYTVDCIDAMNFYLELSYGSTDLAYWKLEYDQILPDLLGAAIVAVLSVAAFICGISMSRRKRSSKELERELNWLGQLLSRGYAVDLIPLQYRTPRCIFYLYNWFHAGTSDDLSIALNTFMHESAERLDRLMSRQGREILKQRTALARQMQPAMPGGPTSELRAQLNAYLVGPNNL